MLKLHTVLRCGAVLVLLVACGGSARADDVSDVLTAFQQYVARSASFDPSVADLYADTATIRSKRIMPDGTTPTLAISGMQWKALIRQALPLAKQRGDRNTFRNVSAKPQGKEVVITAERYSHLRAYASPFVQHWSKDQTGAWRISTEVTETRP